MKYINGDLLDYARQGMFDVIAHGCNCFCQMGGGIARQIRDECKEAYIEDRMTIPADKSKLGTMTYATIKPIHPDDKEYIVCNLYTQYDYSRNHICADYDAIRSCMILLRENFGDTRIGLPLIGAGLAGGDWDMIEKIIREELVYHGVDVTIVEYAK